MKHPKTMLQNLIKCFFCVLYDDRSIETSQRGDGIVVSLIHECISNSCSIWKPPYSLGNKEFPVYTSPENL